MSEIGDQLRTRLVEAVDAATHPQKPPVNLYETDEALVAVAALPGVMADDIEITVEPRRLTITAAMRTAAPKQYLLHEWTYGPYAREVEIPDDFGAQVTASFGNGQLAIQLGRGTPDGRVTAKPR
ncbi:MAG: Hsp20/alpha crystallin family protein [Acidimicrobiia bacterium]|nr:Hsp20/alpha crystallin family protein [Acidimicrobiia bacterium]MBV9040723.1 Hsp20/alpha crystallin family protein [Acidimicrobiia bacterium]MBV9283977.1 Hsp20/alpha crystallin family protein [Acidimicrobiia bacterium]